MLKMTDKIEENTEPPSPGRTTPSKSNSAARAQNGYDSSSLFQKIKGLIKGKNDPTLREAIEEYIVEAENGNNELA